MKPSEFEQIGPFKVHNSILSGLNGWEPHYWTVLTLDTRKRLKKQMRELFRVILEKFERSDLEEKHPDYINHLILRAANRAIASFWRDCIYEHKVRLYDIQEGKAGPCGARNKNGQQCLAKAIHGSGRCRHHGGKSTGPKTIEGKIKSLSRLMQYRRRPELLIEKRRQLEREKRKETGF